jgi:hypothetical protein
MGCIPASRFRISVCIAIKASVVRKQLVVCSGLFEHNLHCGDDDDDDVM